jgi:hypothetical protein
MSHYLKKAATAWPMYYILSVLVLLLGATSCASTPSPAAQEKILVIDQEMTEVSNLPPTPDRAERLAKLKNERETVISADKKDQAMWWAQLLGTIVGGGALGGAASRLGRSRSQSAVDALQERMEEFEETVMEVFDTVQESTEAFERGMEVAAAQVVEGIVARDAQGREVTDARGFAPSGEAEQA